MNIRIQIIVAVVVVFALCIIINMVRRKRLELRYALIWLLMGMGILILNGFPSLIAKLAESAGVVDPVNMLFFVGFCFSLAIIFVLTVAISRIAIRMKQLAQTIALFENRINLEQKDDKEK